MASQLRNWASFRYALRPVKKLYGDTTAISIGPKALRDIRHTMIEQGWCRTHVNKQVPRIKLMFKWAVAQELVPPTMYQALQAVSGLRAGRTDAKDHEPVKPVPQAHVDAIEPHVSRQVWAPIQSQLLTGARAGELVIMRAIDLDMSGDVWTYSSADHKGAHHGHKRTIFIGPKAQDVITPFLTGRPTNAFLFSPREAEAERLAAKHEARVTPIGHGNTTGTNRTANP